SVQMTAVPQLVSLFNAVGGGAAALLAVHDLTTGRPVDTTVAVTAGLDIVIGGVTFTGSLIAAGKLQGLVTGRPVTIPNGRIVNLLLVAAFVAGVAWLVVDPASRAALLLACLAALVFGVTMVLPIG